MSGKKKNNKKTSFPRGAMALFIAICVGVISYEILSSSMGILGGQEIESLLAIVIGVMVVVVAVGISYVFTKFPTQWISKEDNVYKYDIWSALLYSSTIGVILNFLLEQFNYQENLFLSIIVSIITTALFIFFYYSGEEKESQVKRAFTIVQISWLVLGIVLSVISSTVNANLLV